MVVLVVGPNPAVQRVLRFDALELGGVNRASGLDQYVGGKGQGAALALQLWAPEEGPHAVAQFLGGESGRYVESALAAAGLATITQQVAGPTRTCTTLLHDGGTNTELIDPCDAANPNPNPNPNLNPNPKPNLNPNPNPNQVRRGDGGGGGRAERAVRGGDARLRRRRPVRHPAPRRRGPVRAPRALARTG